MSSHLEQFESASPEAKASTSSFVEELYGDLQKQASTLAKVLEQSNTSKSANELLAPLDIVDDKAITNAAKPAEMPGGDKSDDSKPDPRGDSGDKDKNRIGDTGPAQSKDAPPPKGLNLSPAGYNGEDIKREIEPAVITDTNGKTLQDIARDHLGNNPPPTKEEIDKHVKELAKINDIKDPSKALEGQPITAPGHDKYGGMVTIDADGNKRHSYQDNAYVVWNKNGSGNDHHPTKDGGYTEHHWGPKPEDNYELRRTADGKIQIADAGKDNWKDAPEKPADPRVEESRLRDAADKAIKDPKERAKFEADMQHFEDRMQKAKEKYEKQGMTPEQADKKAKEEVAETYKEIRKILEAQNNPNTKLTEKDRVRIAEQVMSQAANPQSIDQGTHPTCNVSTVETRTYTDDPSKAAKLVADVATTGEYSTPTNPPVKVKVDTESLKAHNGADKNPLPDGSRSHASQIFQVTTINAYYNWAQNSTDGQPKYRYEQKEGNEKTKDSGERVMDYSDPAHPKVHKTGSPDIAATSDGIVKMDELVTGRKDQVLIEREGLDNNGKDTTKVKDQAELDQKLKEAKEKGQLPMVVKVWTGDDPFLTDSGRGEAGGSGGWHVVTITDYHPAEAGPPAKPARVDIDNQWGSQQDRTGERSVPVDVLFKAMDDKPDKVASPTLDELDKLRDQKAKGKISDKQYDEELKNLMLKAMERWEKEGKEGKLNEFEKNLAVEAWRHDLKNLQPSPDRGKAIIKKMAQEHNEKKKKAG